MTLPTVWSRMRNGDGLVSRILSRVPITLAAKPRPSPWPRLFWRQKNELLLSVTLEMIRRKIVAT